MQEEYAEIDLREIIYLLWNNKKIIIGFFLIATIGAAIVSQFFLAETFEASATLYAPSFTLLNQETLNNGEYTNFFYRREVLDSIIDEYELREENPDISYENVRDKLKINIDEDNNIVRLKLQDSSPELAAAMLESWYILAQEELINFIESRNDRYLYELENSTKRYQNEYLASLDELVEFQKEVNIDLLRSELKSRESSFVHTQEKIADLNIALKKAETEHQLVLKQIENTERFIELKVPISESVFYLFANELANVDDFFVHREVLNSQFEKIESNRNNLEQRIAGQKEELAALENRLLSLETDIDKLQKEIVKQDNKWKILQKENDLYHSNYDSAEKRYHSKLQQLDNHDYNVNIINTPLVPRSRISPNKKLNVAIAAILGVMLAVFYIFFREYMNNYDVGEQQKKANSLV
ncbi:MAG: GumC family protein [bacterium]